MHDLHEPVIMKEVGSGLNDRRRKLQELIVMVLDHKVSRVFVTYKDRLTRFGFHYLEAIFNNYEGVPIIAIRDEAHEKTVQEELVEDMMSLIANSQKRTGI